ncbi:MAG: FmdB family zinc ribbon protein [bacterium]
MPLYDYKCKKCAHIFEVQQKMTDDQLEKCPKCGGAIHRLISAAGIVFKGSGFHVTDYGRSKQKAESSKQSTDAGGQMSGTGGEGLGEKKAETKPKTKAPKSLPKESSPQKSK